MYIVVVANLTLSNNCFRFIILIPFYIWALSCYYIEYVSNIYLIIILFCSQLYILIVILKIQYLQKN